MSTHRKNLRTRQAVAVVSTAALGLSLAACSTDEGAEDGSGESDMTVTLGYIPTWPDGKSMAYLLDNQLTAAGYTVEHEEISDAGVLYTALAEGDVDIYPSAWSEGLHTDYMEQYEGDLEDLGMYFPDAMSYLAVPEYTDIDSIEELAENPDMFDGTITGIGADSGIMATTENEVMPAYGLEEAGFELQVSDATSMLAALGEAIDNEEDIVVTMWSPYWPNAAYPIKPIEDPQGAYGDGEGLHFIGHAGFGEEYPEVADWLGQLDLADSYQSLEDLLENDYVDDPAAGVEAWLEENPDAVPAFEG
jgi:glycine betaine/proline transport system substrate-binding protein